MSDAREALDGITESEAMAAIREGVGKKSRAYFRIRAAIDERDRLQAELDLCLEYNAKEEAEVRHLEAEVKELREENAKLRMAWD